MRENEIQPTDTTDNSVEFGHLPDDLLRKVFSFFTTPEDLLRRGGIVSKRFQLVSENEQLWEAMYAENISNPPDRSKVKSFQDAYKEVHLSLLQHIDSAIKNGKVNDRMNGKVNDRMDLSKIDGYDDPSNGDQLEKAAEALFQLTDYFFTSFSYKGENSEFPYNNYYPLHAAISANAVRVVEKLLKAEANIDISDYLILIDFNEFSSDSINRICPIHLAAKIGNLEIVHLLLNAGATLKTDPGTTLSPNPNPLAIAIEAGHLEIVKVFMEHNTASSANYQETLLQHLNHLNQNLLHLAAKSGNLEMFKLVFSHNEAMQDLVNSTDRDGNTPLHLSVQSGNSAIVEVLLDKDTINMLNQDRRTPLHLACASPAFSGEQREELVVLLLANGASQCINMQDYSGMTPLHYVAANGYIQLMALLFSQGAKGSLHIKDTFGNTPLHIAANRDSIKDYYYVSVIQLLLTNGADEYINEENSEGRTPYEYAQERCSSDDLDKLFNLAGRVKTLSIC